MDEVDRIVSAWQSIRPDLDVTPLTIFSRVTRLARFLDRARSAAFADHHIEVWEFDVLSALRRAGDPFHLTPGQLGNATMVTSGTMTNRISRLAERGLVERTPDPHDGRGALVRLTPQGIDLVDVALESLLTREWELLDQLQGDDRSELARLLRTMVQGFE